jgi:hypothetical protein
MNNKIEPTYVTFEQAKLLADKRFLIHTRYGYTKDGVLERPHYGETYINSDFENSLTYSAPEQYQVAEWLLQNHRLDIIVKYPESNTNKIEGINSVYYDLEIYRLQGGDAYKVYKFIGISDKKQEAYSAAFDYILNNLI